MGLRTPGLSAGTLLGSSCSCSSLRAGAVLVDEPHQALAAWPAPGPDVAGRRLVLTNVHVGIEHERGQVVGRITGHDALRAPVIRQTNLVDLPPLDLKRHYAVGDQHARLDSRALSDDRRPSAVLEVALLGELGADLTEHLGLELREVRHRSRHAARR